MDEQILEKEYDIRGRLEKACNKEDLEVTRRPWEQDWYTATYISRDPPLRDQKDQILIVGEDNKNMEKGIASQFRDRFPGLEVNNAHGNGSVTFVRQSTSRIGQNGNTKDSVKYGCVVFEENDGKNEAMIFKTIKSLRDKLIELGRKEVAIVAPQIDDPIALRKTIEIVFRKEEIKATIHVPQGIQMEDKGASYANAIKIQPQRKPRENDALIVRRKNTTYMDLIKMVRTGVNGQNVCKILRAQKTRGGELLLITEKNPAGTEELAKLIREKVQGAEVRNTSGEKGKVTLRFNNIDGDFDKEEIVKEIKIATGIDDMVFQRATDEIRHANGPN